MKKIKKALSLGLVALGSLVNPKTALAEVAETPTEFTLDPGTGFDALKGITVVSILQGAIRLILVTAAIIFFFVLVVGGIQWITAGGDKAGTEAARKRITNALIGLAIVFAAWAIISLINLLFGINIFELNIPSFTV